MRHKRSLHMTTEEKAIKIGQSRDLLKTRLLYGKLMLVTEYRKKFTNAIFDFEHKCLFSRDKKWFLQWKLRAKPSEPIGYFNQQTSRGNVYLIPVIS